MFLKVAAVAPLSPQLGGLLDPLERLLDGGGRGVLGPVLLAGRVSRARPYHRDVGAISLPQRLGRMRARAFETDAQIGDEPDRHLVLASAGERLVVTGPGVLPVGVGMAVVENRLAVERQLDLADDAASGPQQDVL